MQRFVYSPKAYAYISTEDGIINVSDYIVSGEVSRKVNQVSTASITLRNPNRRWSSNWYGKGGGPIFRPMDPITIYLKRLPNRPVQVFTGYLDETPYFQMYPGTVTLKASCTLKKLLYTYFDPGLENFNKFLAQYGWAPNRLTGQIVGPQGLQLTQATQDPNTPADQEDPNKLMITDGSFGKLLFATIKHIGKWHPSNVYIEQLPEDLPDRISVLYNELLSAEKDQQLQKALNTFFSEIIGKNWVGGGGATGGAGEPTATGLVPGAPGKQAFCFFVANGFTEEQAAGFVGNFQQENGLSPKRTSGGLGIVQWIGGREAAARAYAERKGKSAEDLGLQLEFILYELKNSEASALPAIKAAKSPEDAAVAISEKYERPGTPMIENRKKYARDAFTQFSGKCGVATPGDDPDDGDNSPGRTTMGTRYEAIVAEANRMNEITTIYDQGPGGVGPGKTRYGPTNWDCSSATAHILRAAGYNVPATAYTGNIANYLLRGKDPTNRVTIWLNKASHVFVEFSQRSGEKMWGTNTQHSGHAVSYHNHTTSGFEPYHVSGLDDPASIPADGNTDVAGGGGSTDSTGGRTSPPASAFATVFNFPGVEQSFLSQNLIGDKSLMNDQPLLPFVQQLANASMRSFQSLPNGAFYAFFPDYFGAFGTRKPYWQIQDIEILDGTIELTDDSLATHVYVVGAGATEGFFSLDQIDKLNSKGVVTIMNAGILDFIHGGRKDGGKFDPEDKKVGLPLLGTEENTRKFLEKFGARPVFTEAQFIRNPYFETFMAFQEFMLLWARQWLTTFSFTFMPELYPGGLVSLPNHGIQMYVDEVSHQFSYDSGFTTQANLSAPAALNTGGPEGISEGMVTAGAFAR